MFSKLCLDDPVNAYCVTDEVNKHKQANGETCHVAGLEPYTSYTCEIQPTYHNKKVRQPTVVQQRTEIGSK